MITRRTLITALLVACSSSLTACDSAPGDAAATSAQTADGDTSGVAAAADTGAAGAAGTSAAAGSTKLEGGPTTDLPHNELGRIPVLEYHLVGEPAGRWTRTPAELKADMQLLYDRGYRPVNMVDVLDKKLDLPAGMSPVVFVFDDASPSQFRYIERNGTLEIDPTSAIGVWLDFQKTHPDWDSKAVFCVLSGAEAGRSFFGNKGIEGQKNEWRYKKLQFLNEKGFEICNHTLWHMTMSKYGDAAVQEQIARLDLAVDSAIPGYRIRTLALPLGEWPKNKQLSWRGQWTDPKTGTARKYDYDAVLLVAGGPARSPHDPQFDPKLITREQILGDQLRKMLDRMDSTKDRYVSDGNPGVVARPTATTAAAAQ